MVEIDREGIPRVRKTFSGRREAELFEREYLLKHAQAPNQNKDRRKLLELVEIWHMYHGINLSDGERRKRKLEVIAVELNNPVAAELTAEAFAMWRYNKLRGDNALQEKTLNNLHGYLAAMYKRLRKMKVIEYESPLVGVDMIKIHERQLSYLSKSQIETLLQSIEDFCVNESTWYVAQLCLRTGARWGEAEQLRMK